MVCVMPRGGSLAFFNASRRSRSAGREAVPNRFLFVNTVRIVDFRMANITGRWSKLPARRILPSLLFVCGRDQAAEVRLVTSCTAVLSHPRSCRVPPAQLKKPVT